MVFSYPVSYHLCQKEVTKHNNDQTQETLNLLQTILMNY